MCTNKQTSKHNQQQMDYLRELQMKAHLISCKVLGLPAFTLKRKDGPDMEAPVSKKARITRVRHPRPRRYKYYKARPPPRFVYVTIPVRKPPPPPMKIYKPYIFSLKLENNFKFLEEET